MATKKEKSITIFNKQYSIYMCYVTQNRLLSGGGAVLIYILNKKAAYVIYIWEKESGVDRFIKTVLIILLLINKILSLGENFFFDRIPFNPRGTEPRRVRFRRFSSLSVGGLLVVLHHCIVRGFLLILQSVSYLSTIFCFKSIETNLFYTIIF